LIYLGVNKSLEFYTEDVENERLEKPFYYFKLYKSLKCKFAKPNFGFQGNPNRNSFLIDRIPLGCTIEIESPIEKERFQMDLER